MIYSFEAFEVDFFCVILLYVKVLLKNKVCTKHLCNIYRNQVFNYTNMPQSYSFICIL